MAHAYDAPSVYIPPTPTTHPPEDDEWVELRRAIANRFERGEMYLDDAIKATQQLRG